MTQDPASGLLTFALNSDGDFYLDDRALYPVIATLFAEKGRYAADPTVGTYLATIRQDGAATATRLNAAMSDALEQCRRDGLLVKGSAAATRLRTGAWAMPMSWQPFSGSKVDYTMKF